MPINRHQFAMDLLRPGISVEELVEFMSGRQELTKNDLRDIIRASEKIKMAAQIRLMNT